LRSKHANYHAAYRCDEAKMAWGFAIRLDVLPLLILRDRYLGWLLYRVASLFHHRAKQGQRRRGVVRGGGSNNRRCPVGQNM
jgi:hypothetical protein